MSKQVLDMEQAMRLKELGLDTSKASMCYRRKTHDFRGKEKIGRWSLAINQPIIVANFETYETVPTFTLQDILDILPKEMTDKDGYKFVLKIEYGLLSRVWHIGYYYYDVASHGNLYSGDNLIDTVYKMLCWCIKNGYINSNKGK